MADVTPTTEVAKWLGVIAQYNREFKKWEGRVREVLKRYRDDNPNAGTSSKPQARFNILWSNVQTLKPAVYAKLPLADVSRRFSDNDPVGRVASLIIERGLNFEVEHYPDYRSTMNNSVEDRFLGGRGVGWVRYEPHIKAQDIPEDGLEITEDADETEPAEEIEYECAPTDYVHWKDFGHTVARTWEEVTAVWRWVYMDKAAVEERFGPELAARIPYNSSPDQLNSYRGGNKPDDKAKICEIWDKTTQTAKWLCDGVPDLLDERPDPLELEGFFPCPKPLYATTTSDTLVPVPDYTLYQDQAADLDILVDRIDGFVKSLRVRGVYDSSVPALQRLLTEGDNNTLVPVENWGGFSEKGGLKGAIDLLPLDVLSQALLDAYQAQNNIKAQIYEITGISDIIRGASHASESATAQQIKGQYAGLRLKSMQDGVALFASELLRLKAQVMCSKFQDKTLLAYASAAQLSPEDQQYIPQALQLIRDKPLRNFRIEVAADSLVMLDEAEQKKERVEFITALGGFLKEAIPAGQAAPQMVPMLMESLKFVVAGFKQARPIEGAIDAGLEQLKQAAKQAQANPPPNPEVAKAQAQAQADMQKEQLRAQTDAQIAHIKAQSDMMIDQARMQHEAQLSAAEAHHQESFERWKAELDAARAIMVAFIGAKMSPEGSVGLEIAQSMDVMIEHLSESAPVQQ